MPTAYNRKNVIIGFILIAIFSLLAWKGGEIWAKKVKKDRKEQYLLLAPHAQVTISEMFPPLSQELIPALEMPYFFLGKGKQASAYTSIDETYVLKIIKWPKKERKRRALLFSLGLAATKLSKESGLLGIAYGPSIQAQNLPQVTALDSRGKIESIPLSQRLFVIQERAEAELKKTLFELRWRKDITQGTLILKAVFELLNNCRQKEIIDRDGALIRNGNIALKRLSDGSWKALYIDIGKLSIARKDEITKHDIKRLKPLASWIRDVWPELLPAFKELNDKYESMGD